MATYYLSDLMLNGGVVAHSAVGGQEIEVTGTVRIPAGTDLATDDRLVFCRLPEGAVVLEAMLRTADLDDGSALTLDIGYQRPLENPGKAYNATTNDYTDNAIATADPDFIEAAATTAQAGGILLLSYSGFTVTSQAATGLSGDADFCATVVTGAATASTNGGQVKLTLKVFFNDEQTQGEFSGRDALDYNTNYTF